MKSQASLLLLASAAASAAAEQYEVPSTPTNAGEPFTEAFVSFSIEFVFFPDFAGNSSAPNDFSYNLLSNLGDLQGTKPHIRVGGNTQDYALYNASLATAVNGTYDLSRSADYPTTVFIGPSFFESYGTWPGVKFSHGFNLGQAGNNSEGWETLVQTVPLACKALGTQGLSVWEYGNEPDLYSTSSQGAVRPPTWNESTYVWQWLNGTAEIKRQIKAHCPELAGTREYQYMAPSFAGVGNRLNATIAWEDGQDKNSDIKLFSTHNYISGAASPGVTLQGTLLNHSRTMQSVNTHIVEYDRLAGSGDGRAALIFGEMNSLYNEGKPGLSNSFGAALWGVDFNLYSASAGFKRTHMHQGTDYRYASWQPITTADTTKGTKAPYYGNIAVAAMLGDTTKAPVSIAQVPLSSDAEAAYAAYTGGALQRVMVVNMHGYNTTQDGEGLDPLPSPSVRPIRDYTLALGGAAEGQLVGVQRLMANGSDAITGITFDGWSYNLDLDNGKPVRLANVTTGETLTVKDGAVTVQVPDSSVVLLSLLKSRPHLH